MKSSLHSIWKDHAGLILICLLFVATGILRLNDLSLYTPDSTRYVIWGNSLAEGRGFLDATQPEPDRYVIHAPLYAVLIAPAELLFPLSLTAVKIWTLLWGVLTVVLLYIWLQPRVGKTGSLIGALLFAFNPLTILYSSEALSESPFIAFVLLAMILSERITSAGNQKSGGVLILVLSVAAAALAREVGVAMVIAVVVYLLVRMRPKVALSVILTSGFFLALWYIRNQVIVGLSPGSQRGNLSLLFQHFVTPSDASIVNELALRMWLNLKEYASQIGGMLFYPLFATHQTSLYAETSSFYNFLQSAAESIRLILILPASFLLISGVFLDQRNSASAFLRLSFTILYLAIIFAYPIHDIRFLAPVLPLMIYYLLVAVRWYVRERKNIIVQVQRGQALGVACVLMVPNFIGLYYIVKTNIAYERSPLGFYASLQGQINYPPIFTQPWTLLGRWIQQNIPQGETIATPSKELSIVVGDRKVMELDPGLPLPLFEKLLRDNRVSYILAPIRWQDLKTYEFLMNESRRFWFEPVHKVANLVLMKIHSRLTEPIIPGEHATDKIDTSSASALLRAGRAEIIRCDYDAATRLLSRGLDLAQGQPQLLYQLVIAFSQMGDTANSQKAYHRFITLPQVGSYIVLARFQMQAMDLYRKASSATNIEERSVKTLDVASTYWNSGYYQRASAIINVSLDEDSLYFSGLLWGFHYAFQLGDTSRAFRCLRQLIVIDPVNPVVVAFEHVQAVFDSLGHATSPAELSRLHLSLAGVYRQIELREEALDEAERALAADRTNLAARLFIAESFERASQFRSAQQVYKEMSGFEPGNMIIRAKIDTLEMRLSR